jgi:hypothetical protein
VGCGEVENGEEEYIRFSSTSGVVKVGDLGIGTGTVKGFGVL